MTGTLTFQVETTSVQKLAALREKLASVLTDEENVTLVNSASSQLSRRYEVLGANTLTKEPWRKSVEATDEEAAAKEAVGTDKPAAQVVVEVRPQ